MKFNMEFFDNKRLLVVLSGVACILIALVIFVMSVIGFGNIGAFLGGKPSYTEAPTQNNMTPNSATGTPTVVPSQTPGYTVPTAPVTTPPATEIQSTTPPVETETPTGTVTEEPTPTPTETVVPVTNVTIIQGASYTMTVGDTVQLQASILPSNATNQKLTWDGGTATSVAVVSKDGYVVAMAAGEIWVTVRSEDGAFDQIQIIINPKPTPTPEETPTPTETPTQTEEPTLTPEATPENATAESIVE